MHKAIRRTAFMVVSENLLFSIANCSTRRSRANRRANAALAERPL